MGDQFFVKVLSAAVKVVRRAKDGAVVMRHSGFDQATGKPILEPATRAVFVEKGQPVPDDVADGELERLQGLGVIGRKAAVTVVAEQPKAASTPAAAPKKEPGKAPARKKPTTASGTAKRKKKATDLGNLGGLSDKQLVKVLVDEKPGVKKLVAAVGSDKELAARVLTAERQTGSEPRTGLVTALEKVIAGAES